MNYFLHYIELPFSKIKIFYREINTREQFLLAKFSAIYPLGQENDLYFFTALEKIINGCVENKEDLLNLDIIEYILLLVKIRILSFDNTLELQLNPTSEEKMVKKFSINLVNFIKRLYEAASEFIINNKINYKNIEVNLGWPNIKSNMLLLEESKDISPTIIEYINYIKIKENIIDLKSFEKKQKDEIYERLPLKLKIQIENKISENIKKLFKKDLFELEDMNGFKFNFYDSSYVYFRELLLCGYINIWYTAYG